MIFEKIRERLQKLCEQTYYNSVNGNRDEGIRNNAYHNAIDIINQVEAEYNSRFEPTIDSIDFGADGFNKYIKSVYNKGYSDAEKHYMDVIDSQQKLIDETKANNGWIKCEGKTFAVGCKYLIVDKDNDIYIATYLNDNVFATRDKDYFMPIKLEATYCQLLPLPPQSPKGE